MTYRENGIEMLTSIDEIGKQSMDSIGCDGFYSYEWLKTLEVTKPFRILPRYFVSWENETPTAIAPCFIEYTSQYHTIEEYFPFTRIVRELGRRAGSNNNPPLVCNSPSSFHSRIVFDKHSGQREILRSFSRRMDEFCVENKALMSSFPHVSQFDALLMNELPALGYLGSPIIDTYYLDILWSSFEDYLKSLSCNMRRNVRREIQQCSEEGVTIKREREFGNLSDELSHLYNNVYKKYNGGNPSPLNGEFFNGLSNHARGKVRLITARKNGELTGFCVLLCHNLTLDVFVVGFDYNARTKTDCTYFNLCYYEPIQMAIDEGLKRINFRGASDEAKLRRGCKRETMYAFIKVQNCALRPLIDLYLRFINLMRNNNVRIPSLLCTPCNSAASN